MGRVLSLAIPHWRPLLAGTLLLAIGAAAGLVYPQAIRVIIDTALEEGDHAAVNTAAVQS